MAARLTAAADALRAQWQGSAPIRHFVIDALLPDAQAQVLSECFPRAAEMRLRDTFRERKSISAQMDRHAPQLEAALFAFHAPAVVAAVRAIVGKDDLEPDAELYAAGLSRMGHGDFLSPHIDNSHDGARVRWRNLNLLYYVAPDFGEGRGGELELWPDGMSGAPVVLPARFNRLVVMETHHQAWHSVAPVRGDIARCCISNYYFAPTPMRADQDFHVTSFRARPGQDVRDWLLRADSAARMWLRKGFRHGLLRSAHRYRR